MRESRLTQAVILVLLVSICVSGCSNAPAELRAEQVVLEAIGTQEDLPDMERRSYSDQDFSEWAARIYGVDLQGVNDASVAYASGLSADEVVVFKSNSSAEASDLVEPLEQYRLQREAAFAGYAPDEERKVSDGVVESVGPYTLLIIGPSPDEASQAAMDIISGAGPSPRSTEAASTGIFSSVQSEDGVQTAKPTSAETVIAATVGTQSEEPWTSPEPPRPEDSSFNQDAVLAAWEERSPEKLSGQELEVYNAASRVLADVIDDSMSDYEKELELHDYLMDNVQYDDRVFDHDYSEVERYSATPYGALVKGRAICYGFSSTYELLMNMAGIDCLRVDGTAESTDQLHSWNVVCLDGDWYCVDIAWDRNAKDRHKYFNRTSGEYASWNRKWDREAMPEATGGRYAYDS